MQAALKLARDKLTKNPKDDRAWVDYGNLLWGASKPLLSKIAYERSLALNAKNVSALNNRAVILISADGQEDWYRAEEGDSLLHAALAQDEFALSAKANLASLLTYYRLFAKAQPYWNQVVLKAPAGGSRNDSYDGIGICAQGLGDLSKAESSFKSATDGGASPSRFARVFNAAARNWIQDTSSDGKAKCLAEVSTLSETGLDGFEKLAVENLKRSCGP
jgi:Tfp pilus assembly protein PilF